MTRLTSDEDVKRYAYEMLSNKWELIRRNPEYIRFYKRLMKAVKSDLPNKPTNSIPESIRSITTVIANSFGVYMPLPPEFAFNFDKFGAAKKIRADGRFLFYYLIKSDKPEIENNYDPITLLHIIFNQATPGVKGHRYLFGKHGKDGEIRMELEDYPGDPFVISLEIDVGYRSDVLNRFINERIENHRRWLKEWNFISPERFGHCFEEDLRIYDLIENERKTYKQLKSLMFSNRDEITESDIMKRHKLIKARISLLNRGKSR